MAKSIASITPPLTPVDFSQSTNDDELDYMNFLNSDIEINENEVLMMHSVKKLKMRKLCYLTVKGNRSQRRGLRENFIFLVKIS
ncbi:hypothetical protein Avbf_00975 [Armadillidium vulgare]|nr:hypothetical protein Avbf_00975 [Armadillidium vulgare]